MLAAAVRRAPREPLSHPHRLSSLSSLHSSSRASRRARALRAGFGAPPTAAGIGSQVMNAAGRSLLRRRALPLTIAGARLFPPLSGLRRRKSRRDFGVGGGGAEDAWTRRISSWIWDYARASGADNCACWFPRWRRRAPGAVIGAARAAAGPGLPETAPFFAAGRRAAGILSGYLLHIPSSCSAELSRQRGCHHHTLFLFLF